MDFSGSPVAPKLERLHKPRINTENDLHINGQPRGESEGKALHCMDTYSHVESAAKNGASHVSNKSIRRSLAVRSARRSHDTKLCQKEL